MTARIRLLWLPQAQFAGYLIAECSEHSRIVCQPADFSIGPIEALLRGDCEFAVASPAHIMESASPADLVWLLTIQQTSPLVYPVRRSSGIGDIAGLAGRRIAVWPGGEDLEFRWMMARAGLRGDEIDRVPVKDTVAAFLEKGTDCAQMTSYHELHLLEAALGTLKGVRLLRASDLGIGLIKDGLVARRDFVRRETPLVEQVVHEVLAGWTLAFADTQAAIRVCLDARPDMAQSEHARQLRDIRALSLTRSGLGYPDPLHVSNAIDAARETGHHPGSVSVSRMVIDTFWRSAPSGVRGLTM